MNLALINYRMKFRKEIAKLPKEWLDATKEEINKEIERRNKKKK